MSEPASNRMNDSAITVVISRRVIKGKEALFESLSNEMTVVASLFQGYIGADIFKPVSANDPEYRIIFRFSDEKTLAVWQASNERAKILEKIEPLLVSSSRLETKSGIINWFTLPSHTPVIPPAKYKMTFVSWLALYPTVTLIFVLFGDLLAEIPLLLRTMLITAVVMVAMSYVLMPRFTRWFAFWLFPKQEQDER